MEPRQGRGIIGQNDFCRPSRAYWFLLSLTPGCAALARGYDSLAPPGPVQVQIPGSATVSAGRPYRQARQLLTSFSSGIGRKESSFRCPRPVFSCQNVHIWHLLVSVFPYRPLLAADCGNGSGSDSHFITSPVICITTTRSLSRSLIWTIQYVKAAMGPGRRAGARHPGASKG